APARPRWTCVVSLLPHCGHCRSTAKARPFLCDASSALTPARDSNERGHGGDASPLLSPYPPRPPHDLDDPVDRQRLAGVAIPPGDSCCPEQRVDDRLLRRLDRGLEQRVDGRAI